MRRGRGLGSVATAVLLLWPVWARAGEGGAVERPKGPAGERVKQEPTPEQTAERQKQMKASLERQAEFYAATAKNFEARRDELKAMTAKETVAVSPPLIQLFTARDLRGGPGAAMRAMAMARRGEARPGAMPRHGTFDVAQSDDLKNAIAKATGAYDAALPLLDEQKKAVDALLKGAAAGAVENPAAMRERMAASQDLMAKVMKAESAVGDAEVDLQLALTKAWLGVAKDKVASDEAKAGAAKAAEAIDKFRALKTQMDELEAKIDEQATALQDGMKQVLPALAPAGRGGRGAGERPERTTPEKGK